MLLAGNAPATSSSAMAAFGVMPIAFAAAAVAVVRYLISVVRLLRQLRTKEKPLWKSLGCPRLLPQAGFHNPFKEFIAQAKFMIWFLSGGEGASEPETIALFAQTKRRFLIALFMLLVAFGGFFAAWRILHAPGGEGPV